MVAFFGTMFLGVEYGLAIAVGMSILIVLYESAYPHTSVLGRLPGTSLYRNIKQYADAEQYDGLVIIRIDGPLYFANAQNIRDKVRKYKRVATEALEARQAGQVVKYIIMDLSPVSHIDTTALHALEDMYVTQKKLGVQLCFCNPGIAVAKRLVKSGIVNLVGREHFFSSVIDAVHWCLHDMDGTATTSRPSQQQEQQQHHDDNTTLSFQPESPPQNPAAADDGQLESSSPVLTENKRPTSYVSNSSSTMNALKLRTD